jgi:hypothetical protein
MGQAVKAMDTTKPVGYDGETGVTSGLLSNAIENYHYPEVCESLPPAGSIYQWRTLVSQTKPTAAGEFLAYYGAAHGEENQWWHGVWTRGMRMVGFDDIRP